MPRYFSYKRLARDGRSARAAERAPLTERSTHNGRRHRGRLLRAVPPRVVVHFCRRDQRRQPAYHTICAGARGPCAKTIKTNCESERAHLHVRVPIAGDAHPPARRDKSQPRVRSARPDGAARAHTLSARRSTRFADGGAYQWHASSGGRRVSTIVASHNCNKNKL